MRHVAAPANRQGGGQDGAWAAADGDGNEQAPRWRKRPRPRGRSTGPVLPACLRLARPKAWPRRPGGTAAAKAALAASWQEAHAPTPCQSATTGDRNLTQRKGRIGVLRRSARASLIAAACAARAHTPRGPARGGCLPGVRATGSVGDRSARDAGAPVRTSAFSNVSAFSQSSPLALTASSRHNQLKRWQRMPCARRRG